MPDARRVDHLRGGENVTHPDELLRELAARQHGVVARRQLLAAGLTARMIERRAAGRQLVTLHRGVYAVGHARLRREGHWLAAVLAAGPGALLSHRDAAALHGLRPPGDRQRIEVTTTGRATSTPRIDVHATSTLDARDKATVAGIPTTSIARTLVDLAAVVTPRELRKALAEAERRRLDVTGIERAMAATVRRNGRGHAELRRALDELRTIGAPVTRSELEDRFLALLDAHDLPRPATNASVEGMEVDACWPDRRVAVELDGWRDHGTRRAFQEDRQRGNDLTAAGWMLLRFTWADVTHGADGTVERMRRALAPRRRYPQTP